MAPTLIFFLLAGVFLYKALVPGAKRTVTWGFAGSGAPLTRASYAAWGIAFASVPPAVWWALTSGSIRPLGLVAGTSVGVVCCAVSDRARARGARQGREASPRASATARRSLHLLLLLAAVTPLGFATKVYSGPLAAWVSGYAGGVLYVLFWILVVGLVRPRASPRTSAGLVFAATSLLEALQTISTPMLDAVRATALGRTLIGSTFSWWDFPHYLLGAMIGAWVLSRVSPTAPNQD